MNVCTGMESCKELGGSKAPIGAICYLSEHLEDFNFK